MDKAIQVIKKNKLLMFVFWLVPIYIISLFIVKGILKAEITILQIAFIFSIGCFTYVDISLSIEYFKLKKLLDSIKKIQVRYDYMQTYMDNYNMIVEVPKIDAEKLKSDVKELNFKIQEFAQDDKLVQFIVNS